MTKCSATRFYRQSWKKIKTILGKIIITLVLVFGNVATFDILNIQKYFQEESTALTLEFWVFYVMIIASFIKILDIWMMRKKKGKDK